MLAQADFLDGLLRLRKFSSIVGDTLLLDWYTRLGRSIVSTVRYHPGGDLACSRTSTSRRAIIFSISILGSTSNVYDSPISVTNISCIWLWRSDAAEGKVREPLNYNRVGVLLYTDTGRVTHARIFSNSPSHTVREAY